MKRILTAIVFLAASPAVALAQQGSAMQSPPQNPTQLTAGASANPVSDTLRQLIGRYSKNMVGAAESMPADKFDYKPTPQQITFAHLVGHIAQSNFTLCSRISGAPAPSLPPMADTDGKDKLVVAIRASFDYCTGVLAKADDSNLGGNVAPAGSPHASTKAATMITLAYDWADHYSAQAIYLRLNGILPPSAQPTPPPGRE